MPYVAAGLGLTGAISWLTVLYAQQLGVNVLQPLRVQLRRMIPIALLIVVLAVGILLAASDAT